MSRCCWFQFWSAYVPCSAQHLDAVTLALEQVDVIRRLVDKYPRHMALVTSAEGKRHVRSQIKSHIWKCCAIDTWLLGQWPIWGYHTKYILKKRKPWEPFWTVDLFFTYPARPSLNPASTSRTFVQTSKFQTLYQHPTLWNKMKLLVSFFKECSNPSVQWLSGNFLRGEQLFMYRSKFWILSS